MKMRARSITPSFARICAHSTRDFSMELPKPPDQQPNRKTQQPLSASPGRYQIQEELGRGAMGAVYKAFDPVISRTVALKTILIDDHAPDRAQMIERLKQEAKAAGRLDHPNIITIYDVGEENGAVYLSMQYVNGTTLAKLLDDVGVPSLTTLLSWADQILAAVGFAHARGVIHRDLKPANLMVTEQAAIKVLDFGIAKIENTTMTQTGLVIGTPSYMAPEQIAGRKVDQRADIFSLGAVFYELLTREKAFSGDIATILYRIVNEHPVAPSLINPAISGGIDAVIRKALAKDPNDRFQTCEEMRQAFLESPSRASSVTPLGIHAGKTLASRPPAASNTRRAPQLEEAPSRVWPRLALGLAIAVIAVASWAFYVQYSTGAFPPFIAKLDSKIRPALATAAGKFGNSSHLPPRSTEAHVEPVPSQQNPATSNDGPNATQTTGLPAVAPAPTTGAALQPVAAQSQSDHPATDSPSVSETPGPSSGSPAMSPAAEASKKLTGPSETALTQPAQSSDNDQSAGGHATAQGSPGAGAVVSREDDKQTPFSSAPKVSARKHIPDAPSTVDGFNRQDVPDLLHQADSYAARGEYRLARYEYALVLKLDRNNFQAREGLRHLLTAVQSR
jgi:serine/threonine protein kinase